MVAVKKERLVPQLRFKEFDGVWEESRLQSKIDFIAGYAFKSFEMKSNDSKYQLLKMSNIYKSELQLDRNPSYWESIDSKLEKYLLKKKDILLTLTGTVGKKDYGYSIVIPEDDRFLLNQRLVSLRAKTNISDPDFINNIIKTSRFYYFFFAESKGGTGNQTNVGINDLQDIRLKFPSLKEQQKIATFLTAVDDKISQLTSKKEQLTQYKKGVMQQLFPSAGSGQVPELRFKDENGNQFPDWEEKRLGEVLKYYDGTHQTPKYVEEGIPFYSVEHVTANHFSKTKFITSEVFEKENNRVKLERGDILMTRIGDIGTSRLIDWDVNASFYVSLALLKQNETFNSTYLNQFISSRFFQNELWKRTIHVAFPKKINLGEIGNCKVKLPSLKEQQKIAAYLSALDDKIEAVQVQIEQTQEFKKGLLQQLFV